MATGQDGQGGVRTWKPIFLLEWTGSGETRPAEGAGKVELDLWKCGVKPTLVVRKESGSGSSTQSSGDVPKDKQSMRVNNPGVGDIQKSRKRAIYPGEVDQQEPGPRHRL